MKRIFRSSGFFLPCLAALSLASCKPTEYENFGDIRGKVVQAGGDTGIPEATVSLSPGGRTCFTDSTGSFGFESLEIQQYTLSVQKEGYASNRKSITPIPGQAVEAIVALSPRN